MEPDARSLEQARNAATMAIIRYAMINMPNRETVTEHNERMGVTDMDIDPPSAPQGQASQPQPQASTSQPQPQASTSLPEPQASTSLPEPQASTSQPQPQASTSQPQPQASTSPLERRPARNRLFAGLNVRSQAETEQARTQRENAQRVESEQERWARERREGGAAIAPRLATANIRLHGGRARAHTTDGGGDRQAGISSQQAIQLVAQAQASDVEANRDGGTDAPTYTIPIPANSMLGIPAGGTIVFSSPDGGVTVNIFHIGPGARH